MKKLMTLIAALVWGMWADAQGLKSVIKKAAAADSARGGVLSKVLQPNATGLSPAEIAEGLKEALQVGIERGTAQLAQANGYLGNASIKILLPAEAQNAEKKLRALGFGKPVDDAIVSMNRAAEDAARSATPIFVNAIKNMSITDGLNILNGGDMAATRYLQEKTTANLTNAFKPAIDEALKKVDATQHWNTLFTHYNKFTTNKVNPDLVGYVTEKALAGLFLQLAVEEQKIRKDPAAQSTQLLKKVFSK